MEKFNNKYRIPSARLQGWDYGANAIYFVTICTSHREHYFGEIDNDQMQLNEIGLIAHQCWLDIPKYFSNVILDVHIVMPNHVHGIVIIDNPVETPYMGVLDEKINPVINKKWKPGTLGVIINQFKRIVTINARKINPDFEWQTRFHDHIVRNDESFQKIKEYIQENPLRWMDDKFYSV